MHHICGGDAPMGEKVVGASAQGDKSVAAAVGHGQVEISRVLSSQGNAGSECKNSNEFGGLSDKNFSIFRTDKWRRVIDADGTSLYEAPTGDIWEFMEGEFAGEQLFTWNAAIRETFASGDRMPTSAELLLLGDGLGQLKRVGCRDALKGSVIDVGVEGFYWGKSLNDRYAYLVCVATSSGLVVCNGNRQSAFSVRCLKR